MLIFKTYILLFARVQLQWFKVIFELLWAVLNVRTYTQQCVLSSIDVCKHTYVSDEPK